MGAHVKNAGPQGDSAREPATALEFEPVKDLVKIPEIEPVMGLGIA